MKTEWKKKGAAKEYFLIYLSETNSLEDFFLFYLFQVRQSIVKEYDQVKEINQTLANFKKDTVHFGGPRRPHEEEPTRDPDVWPPPAPVERDHR